MIRFEPNLRIPGPTALPPTVREGGGSLMANHGAKEFKALTRLVEAAVAAAQAARVAAEAN